MSEPDHQNRETVTAGVDRLLDLARIGPVPPLSPDFMQRLLEDAAATQPIRATSVSVPQKTGVLATLWRGLEQAFGGMPGLAGAGLATGMAFALGVFLPDTASNLAGFANALELADSDLSGLANAADPSLLWTEE